RSPPPQPRQAADPLQVDEVAGGERIWFAAAEEPEALDGPGADLRNRQQPPVAGRLAGVDAAGGDLAGDRGKGDRAFRREAGRLEFGRRPAGDQRRRGNVLEPGALGPEPRAPATDHA